MATEVIQKWTFGKPTLAAANNSIAYWSRSMADPLYSQSSAGWKACLHGRVQTGDDWAALVIPVNELPVPHFDAAQWTYTMTTTQTMGANIVIWAHDPDNPIYRAEITQDATNAGVTKTSGRNAHVFDPTTTQMFYYGEITGTPDTCPDAGTKYTWNQFRTDSIFSTYTIYKITIEMGWEASGTFDPVWVANVILNGKLIPAIPTRDDLEASIFQYATASSAIATTLAPKTPFRLLRVDLHLNAVATQQDFTITVDAGKTADVYDTILLTQAMVGITDLVQTFGEGYEFQEDDEIDCAWTNTDGKTYGITYVWRVLP